ncbi:MAG: hypothetical protein ACI9MC_000965 [Kiritimatiellia bacterium]|jgi:hypothetical protein
MGLDLPPIDLSDVPLKPHYHHVVEQEDRLWAAAADRLSHVAVSDLSADSSPWICEDVPTNVSIQELHITEIGTRWISTADRGGGRRDAVDFRVLRNNSELPSTNIRQIVKSPRGGQMYRIAIDGNSMRGPQDTHDLRRRRAVHRLLAGLARPRLEHPGESMNSEACIEVGWPGHRILIEAAPARLWNNIRVLRELGSSQTSGWRDRAHAGTMPWAHLE